MRKRDDKMEHTKINMPLIDVNEEKAVVTEVVLQEGDMVKTGDIIISIENTKATSDITSPADGYFLPLCKSFDEKKSGDTLAIIFASKEDLYSYKKLPNRETTTGGDTIQVNATKKALALAQELGIDICLVAAGNSGVVREKDIEEFSQKNRRTKDEHKKPSFVLKRERVVIIGAGNGAEVVIDILLDDPDKEIVGLVDDNVKKLKNYNFPLLDCTIKDFPDQYGKEFYDTVIISIGANLNSMKFRRTVFEDYEKRGVHFTNVISKSAEIRRGVQLGVGNVIGAGCYIGTLTIIGNNNSISYGTNIGHHNIIGSHNLFAPGVFTSGSDTIGDSCILPAGVTMVNRAKIGDGVIVPVGYAIANNLEDGQVIKNRCSD